jgi:AcrR family transcriptional regulator
MTHIMNRRIASRMYDSPLREEQAKATRERILDALIEAMKDGLAELSVPAVASRAGVSVPTVYRHFPTKADLFKNVADHVGKRTGLMELAPPTDPASLYVWLRAVVARHATTDQAAAVAMAGALGGEVRRESLMPQRLEILDMALAPAMAHLEPAERKHLRNIAVVLSASGTYRTLDSYLGLSPDEASETVVWALRTLVEAAEGKTTRGGKRNTSKTPGAKTSGTKKASAQRDGRRRTR